MWEIERVKFARESVRGWDACVGRGSWSPTSAAHPHPPGGRPQQPGAYLSLRSSEVPERGRERRRGQEWPLTAETCK